MPPPATRTGRRSMDRLGYQDHLIDPPAGRRMMPADPCHRGSWIETGGCMTEREYVSRVLVLCLGALVACAANAGAQKVTSEADPGVDFSKYKTFAVRDGDM